jgi:hypothetical protein
MGTFDTVLPRKIQPSKIIANRPIQKISDKLKISLNNPRHNS